MGDVLLFATGVLILPLDVQHVMSMAHSLICVSQLRDEGYLFALVEHFWKLCKGLLARSDQFPMVH